MNSVKCITVVDIRGRIIPCIGSIISLPTWVKSDHCKLTDFTKSARMLLSAPGIINNEWGSEPRHW